MTMDDSETATPGVVFHLDEADPAKHASVLRNIRHLIDELDDGSPVELVAHGPGLAAVQRDGKHTDEVEDALGRGVIVAACANTMRSTGISAGDLIDGVTTVPAGVAELVRRQRQGWSYVRP